MVLQPALHRHSALPFGGLAESIILSTSLLDLPRNRTIATSSPWQGAQQCFSPLSPIPPCCLT